MPKTSFIFEKTFVYIKTKNKIKNVKKTRKNE